MKQKKKLFKELYRNGINLQVHYIPIHMQPYYRKKYNFKKGDYPISEKFYNRELSLPIFYSLQKKSIDKITKLIMEFCKKNL